MAIQCEICDSTNLLKQDGVFVCQDCGAKYTTEEIRKMVSGKAEASAAPAAPAPAPKEAPATKPVAPAPKPQKDISQLMQWAEKAHNDGNTEACREYMGEIKSECPHDPRYFALCLKYGFSFSEEELKEMVRKGPEEEKEQRIELAYRLLEEQGDSFYFGNVQNANWVAQKAERLINTDIPQWRLYSSWDEKRMLEIHFKSVIRQLNEYQLPKDDSPDGLYATTNWQIVKSIPMMERYFEKMDKLIPDEYRLPLYCAFCTGARTILRGRFYTEDIQKWKNVRVDEQTTIYGSDLKEAKKVLRKYEMLVAQMKAQEEAALAAKKAQKEREARAAKQAELEAYWEENPEEYNQLKQEQAALTSGIRMLNRAHQEDPEKKGMEKAGEDIRRYEAELHNCGVFQGKRKKELAVLIEVSKKQEQSCRCAYEKNTADYQKELSKLQSQLKQVNEKLNRE